MTCRRVLLIHFVFLFGLTIAHADQPGTYAISALLNRALERSPEVEALGLDAKASAAKSHQAGRWEDPSLEIGAEWKDEPAGKTKFGKLGLSQAIPRPGRLRAREGVALVTVKISELEKSRLEAEVKGRVLELIYAYRVAMEKAAHAKERVDRFKTVEIYLKGRPFAAPQKRAEAAIVRAKLMVLQKELLELRAEEKITWSQLNLYLGFENEILITAPWYKTARNFTLQELSQKAESGNAEIKEHLLRVKVQESELRLSRSESWPGFILSASYADGSGASPEKNYGLGLSFPIPLLNGNRGAIQAAEALQQAEGSRLRWAREKVKADLRAALQTYQLSSNSIVELSTEKIGALEREMKDVDAGFKRGQVDLITYLEADSQHFEILNAILDTQVAFIKTWRELMLLVGEAPIPQEI